MENNKYIWKGLDDQMANEHRKQEAPADYDNSVKHLEHQRIRQFVITYSTPVKTATMELDVKVTAPVPGTDSV